MPDFARVHVHEHDLGEVNDRARHHMASAVLSMCRSTVSPSGAKAIPFGAGTDDTATRFLINDGHLGFPNRVNPLQSSTSTMLGAGSSQTGHRTRHQTLMAGVGRIESGLLCRVTRCHVIGADTNQAPCSRAWRIRHRQA